MEGSDAAPTDPPYRPRRRLGRRNRPRHRRRHRGRERRRPPGGGRGPHGRAPRAGGLAHHGRRRPALRRFTGSVRASYGTAVGGRQLTSEIARTDGALAAVNGGFFVISPDDGIPGEPAGIGEYDGTLQSEASNGRVALLLDGSQTRI